MNKKKFKLLLLITIPVLAIAAAIPLTTTLTSCNKNGSGESESLDAGKLSNVQFVDSDFSDIFQFMYDQDSAGLLYGDFFLTIYPILPKNSVTIGIEDYPAEPTEPVLPQDETDGGAAEEVEEGSPGSWSPEPLIPPQPDMPTEGDDGSPGNLPSAPDLPTGDDNGSPYGLAPKTYTSNGIKISDKKTIKLTNWKEFTDEIIKQANENGQAETTW